MALDLSEAPEGAGGWDGEHLHGCSGLPGMVGRGQRTEGLLKYLRCGKCAPRFRQGRRDDGIRVKRVPLRDDCRSDPDAMAGVVDDDTMMIVGSAPCFPHDVVDEILPLSRDAESADVWLHVYACVGGYLAPFAKGLGRDMPDFDFSIPGVRSLTAELHKFGVAPKQSSTDLYRS